MNETASGSSGLPSSLRFSRSVSQFETRDEIEDCSLLLCPLALPRLARVVAEGFLPPPEGAFLVLLYQLYIIYVMIK